MNKQHVVHRRKEILTCAATCIYTEDNIFSGKKSQKITYTDSTYTKYLK